MKTLFRTVLITIAITATITLGMRVTGVLDGFFYWPNTRTYDPPRSGWPDHTRIRFPSTDGTELTGWFFPPSGAARNGTVIHYHGSNGNIAYTARNLLWLVEEGYGLFAFDYRGYGRSPGTPSEQGTYLDSRAGLEYLLSRPDVAPEKIVYFGRSLGAAVAVELAANKEPLALVLVAPFSSIADMAKVAFPFMPFHLLVRGRYDSVARIRGIYRPVLILHGDQDSTVPLYQGQKLFEAANQPKRFKLLPGTAHNDTYIAGGGNYWDTLDEFLASLGESSSGSSPD